MIDVAGKAYESYKELAEDDRKIIEIVRKEDMKSILPPDSVRGWYTFKIGGIEYKFLYRVNGWRRWSGFDDNKKDRLDVEPNVWVDYQFESMFKGW